MIFSAAARSPWMRCATAAGFRGTSSRRAVRRVVIRRCYFEAVGRIVVSEFVSVDGVMEDPGGSERSSRGGWVFQFNRGDDGDTFKLEEVTSADALLLGRKTSKASPMRGRAAQTMSDSLTR